MQLLSQGEGLRCFLACLMNTESVIKALASYRYSFQDEFELQAGVAAALKQNAIRFEREFRMYHADLHGKWDQPDFFLPTFGLVIEVKIDFAQSQVIRQLDRYAAHAIVLAILLITSRSCHGMPSSINSKPLRVLNVGHL